MCLGIKVRSRISTVHQRISIQITTVFSHLIKCGRWQWSWRSFSWNYASTSTTSSFLKDSFRLSKWENSFNLEVESKVIIIFGIFHFYFRIWSIMYLSWWSSNSSIVVLIIVALLIRLKAENTFVIIVAIWITFKI